MLSLSDISVIQNHSYFFFNQFPPKSLTISISSPPSMASLHFSVSPYSTSVRSSPSFISYKPQRIAAYTFNRGSCSSSSSSCTSVISVSAGRRRSFLVRSTLETAGPTVTVGQVTEVDKDTFWPIVKAAGDKTVVLDMYTQWCGPCKIIAPKFQELSEKYLDVVFLKLDCNQDNKPLAKELGIRVVPTFKILKDSKIVKEVTGAKIDDLVASIEAVRSS